MPLAIISRLFNSGRLLQSRQRFINCRIVSLKQHSITSPTASSVPSPLRSVKPRADDCNRKAPDFIDAKPIRALGGKGGDGCISLLSIWSNERAGPDGGDGGHGGHVVLRATQGIRDLSKVPTVIKAEDGEKGFNKDCHGKNASHYVIDVPIGTIIKDKSTQEVLADLDENGAMYVLARGGAGGHGNHFFATDTNQTPMIAEFGARGEDISYFVEVKSMAHFGFVGVPNAGKSTLLRAISRARPKVAPYPFTTIRPHLGVVQYTDFEQLAIADLPGLVEGSHQNRGLGIAFLKHVERCSCLLIVVDLEADNPCEQVALLREEMKQFNADLLKRRQLVVANKIDVPGSSDKLKALIDAEGGEDGVVAVSAKFGTNITLLLHRLREIYDSDVRNKP